MAEQWRPVRQAYEVSDRGRVRRSLAGPDAQPGRVLSPRRNKRGYPSGAESLGSIARRLGVRRGTTSKIKHGRTWAHVEATHGTA